MGEVPGWRTISSCDLASFRRRRFAITEIRPNVIRSISDMSAVEAQSWPKISLTWRQRLAAFWLLAWPSWLISFSLLMVLTSGVVVVGLRTHGELLGWASALSFLFCQGLLVRRMIRKRYGSFRLAVVRKNASGTAALKTAEVACIWLRIVWPQVVFLVTVWLAQLALGNRLSADTIRTMATLSLWGRILVVGPFGVYCAVAAEYHTFRLEAIGERLA